MTKATQRVAKYNLTNRLPEVLKELIRETLRTKP